MFDNFNLIHTALVYTPGIYLYFVVIAGVIHLLTPNIAPLELDLPLTNKVFYYGIIWLCGTIGASALYITQKLHDKIN